MGIHHVTAIAGDPQRNLDFYAGVLGLRLVKLTINFDDPSTYHFYYGDEQGRPGSLLTFFPWPGGQRGRQGTAQAATVALSIVPGSLGYWIERLLAQGITFTGPSRRFDEKVLAFSDPDGLLLELVASDRAPAEPTWLDGPLPAEHAIRGLHGTIHWVDGEPGSARFLTETMGFEAAGEEGGMLRFQSSDRRAGSVVYLRPAAGFWRGVVGVGTVHHVAFAVKSGEDQIAKRERIAASGIAITPVIDRQYFQSVYFNEPGGVLFEIATEGPGFTVDEPLAELGTHLKLPPMYQANRSEIERMLPPIRLPHVAAEGGR